MNMYLGIDLHKKTSTWVVIDDQREMVWKRTVRCHPLDISTALKELPMPASTMPIAIEPVCGFRWVTKQLEEQGCRVSIAHPQKVRLIAESKQKTDTSDARTLADLLRADMLPESYRVSDEMYELRVLLRQRYFLVTQRTQAKNRLHGIATTQGLHHITGGNPLQKRGRAWITEGDNVIMQELLIVIDTLTDRIDVLTERVEDHARASKEAGLLMTIPGIGPITALTVVAEVGDFKRFVRANQLARFAGLTPRERSSADRIRLGAITHQGSKYLRTALVEAAMRIRPSYAPELHAFVTRLKPQCGAKRARVALARKMLTIMWALISTNTPYDANTVTQAGTASPSPVATRKEDYLAGLLDA